MSLIDSIVSTVTKSPQPIMFSCTTGESSLLIHITRLCEGFPSVTLEARDLSEAGLSEAISLLYDLPPRKDHRIVRLLEPQSG